MLTVGQEYSWPIEVDTHTQTKALTCTTNGEYLVGGETRVWRVEDTKQMETNARMSGMSIVSLCPITEDGSQEENYGGR